MAAIAVAVVALGIIVARWLTDRPFYLVGPIVALDNGRALVVTQALDLDERFDDDRWFNLRLVTAAGEVTWERDFHTDNFFEGEDVFDPSRDDEMIIVQAGENHDMSSVLHAISVETGETLWEQPLSYRQIGRATAVHGDALWIEDFGINKRDRRSGMLEWTDDEANGVAVTDMTAYSELVAVRDGRVVGREPSRGFDSRGPCLVRGELVTIVTPKGSTDRERFGPLTLKLRGREPAEARDVEVSFPRGERPSLAMPFSALCGRFGPRLVISVQWWDSKAREAVWAVEPGEGILWAHTWGEGESLSADRPLARIGPEFAEDDLPRFVPAVVKTPTQDEPVSGEELAGYRLDVLDLQAGHVAWSQRIAERHFIEMPVAVRAGPRYFVVHDPRTRWLGVLDGASGIVVKAVSYPQANNAVTPSQVRSDLLWLAAPDLRGAHAYALPTLEPVSAGAPTLMNATMWPGAERR
jgi:hypothetical protein